jgi:hypothetical protein
LSNFDFFFTPKIAKKCVLEKNKSHFVSQGSLICDNCKMTDIKNQGFFFKGLALNYGKNYGFFGILGQSALISTKKLGSKFGFFYRFFLRVT